MTTDKTGAPTDVTAGAGRVSISVEGKKVGYTEFIDHDGLRIFPHTVVEEQFGGRGLATILVRHALDATRIQGLRIVPVCSLVAALAEKDAEFSALIDPVTPEIKSLLSSL